MDRSAINEWVQVRIDELQSANGSPTSTDVVESVSNVISQELDPAAFDVIRETPRDFLYPLIETDKKFHHGQGVKDVDVRVIFNDDYSGKILLPADFYLLVSVKMSDWNRPITEIHPIGSEMWKVQQNRITQGTYDRPVGIHSPFASYVTDESAPYTIDNTFSVNVDTNDLYDGQTVDSYAISTGDILVCESQTVDSQNGVYLANASGAPTLLGDLKALAPDLPNRVVEFFKGTSKSATLEELMYISKRKAEDMPDEFVDPMVWLCASRVFSILRQPDLAGIAEEKAKKILVNQSIGLVG